MRGSTRWAVAVVLALLLTVAGPANAEEDSTQAVDCTGLAVTLSGPGVLDGDFHFAAGEALTVVVELADRDTTPTEASALWIDGVLMGSSPPGGDPLVFQAPAEGIYRVRQANVDEGDADRHLTCEQGTLDRHGKDHHKIRGKGHHPDRPHPTKPGRTLGPKH